tara:strand:+ start:83 stop:307 length:225 start_codon:yes stop_codon:yes gene_type:complete
MARKSRKVVLAKFDERAEAGRKIAIAKIKAKAKNDGLTSSERRIKKIKKVANGCWWVEQYLLANMNYRVRRFEE